jgi:hypothetical protein
MGNVAGGGGQRAEGRMFVIGSCRHAEVSMSCAPDNEGKCIQHLFGQLNVPSCVIQQFERTIGLCL